VTVHGWISALPREELVARPVLAALAIGATWESIAERLACCEESRLRFPDRWTAEAETFATFPRAAHVGPDVGAAVEAARRLTVVAAQTGLRVGPITHGALAWALFLAGDDDAAAAEAERALAHPDASAWVGAVIQANAVLSLLATSRGDYGRSVEFARKAVESAGDIEAGMPPATAQAHVAYALALSFEGRFAEAEAEVARSLRAGGPPKDASRVFGLIALASIHCRGRRWRGRPSSG
jgi:hypothetical protein